MKLSLSKLDPKITAQELRKAAQEFGQVESVVIINDIETKKPSGFAYIEMANKEDGAATIKGLKTIELKGKKIKVKEADAEAETGNPKKFFSGGASGKSNYSGGFKGKFTGKGGGGAGRGR